MDDLAVIIPCKNESDLAMRAILEASNYCGTVVFVDDGSDDDSYEYAKKARDICEDLNCNCDIVLLRNRKNMGKSHAVMKALRYIKSNCDAEKVVLYDSDCQFPSNYILTFGMKLNTYDLVMGLRKRIPVLRKPLNILASKLFSLKVKLDFNLDFYTDIMCGLKGFKIDKIRFDTYEPESFNIDFAIPYYYIKTNKPNLNYKNIPVEVHYPKNVKSNVCLSNIIKTMKSVYNLK